MEAGEARTEGWVRMCDAYEVMMVSIVFSFSVGWWDLDRLLGDESMVEISSMWCLCDDWMRSASLPLWPFMS